jgi:hypothetical protein
MSSHLTPHLGYMLIPAQVDSADSLENIETKWKSEIEENCPGVKLVLVALKCDLRERHHDEEDESTEPKRPMIEYKQGLQVAQKIKALRYLGEEFTSVLIVGTGRLLTQYRMFRNEESRRQRSLYRSRSSGTLCEEPQRPYKPSMRYFIEGLPLTISRHFFMDIDFTILTISQSRIWSPSLRSIASILMLVG